MFSVVLMLVIFGAIVVLLFALWVKDTFKNRAMERLLSFWFAALVMVVLLVILPYIR